ncbi:hypothetical protein Cgig2_018872 [Carnegiea gigantea]|uniref:Uncharacterized protein n=1 Tax=Carnegiea gigantea TaxID=171969 RepID=A0A9Q1QEV3_9CARY|nr:hypothetical protein Cgig2_018872 [Carnegiea gigantea]
MAFPHSLDTKTIAEYVTRHFAWYRNGVAFPRSPLPKDFQALCLSFELAVAKEPLSTTNFRSCLRLRGLGSYKDKRFGFWSQPSLSSVGAPSNRGSGCMVNGFSKLGSIQQPDRGRVRESVDKEKARRLLEIFPISSSPNPPSINSTSFFYIGCSGIHLSRGSGRQYRE